MRRKVFLLIFLITNFIFAENGYYYVNLYKPYGKESSYTEEILFYDDGLIKQITHYDLQTECDYYNWKTIRNRSKIIRQYIVNRYDKRIEVILCDSQGEKNVMILTNTNGNVWEVLNKKHNQMI